MGHHNASVIEGRFPKSPENLVQEALTKIGWYMDYSEHELGLIKSADHQSSEQIEAFKAEMGAYEAIKAEIKKLRVAVANRLQKPR